MPNWKKLVVSGSNANLNSLNLSSVVNAGEDTDKFLVLDSAGNIDFRTGANVLSDIGATSNTGTVDTSGTPVDNQLAIFTDANTIEGTTALTYNGTTLSINPGFLDNSIITANTTGTVRVYGKTEVQLESDLEINIGSTTLDYITVSPSEGVIKFPQLGNGFVKQTAGELTIDTSTYSTQTLTLGSDNQIPFMNGTTDFEYSSALTYNDNPTSPKLSIEGTSSGKIALDTTATSFNIEANNTNETFIISDEIFGEPFFVYDKSGGDMLIKIGDSTGFSNTTHIEIDNDNTSVGIKNSSLDIDTIANATTDTDKFLVSDSGTVKYRTGLELWNDTSTLVQTAVGGIGTEDGANTWAKLATYNITANFADASFIYSITNEESTYAGNAIIHMKVRRGASSAAGDTIAFVDYLAGGFSNDVLLNDSFKIVYTDSTDIELWMKKGSTYNDFKLHLLGENTESVTVTYETSPGWQSTEPTGAGGSAQSDGLKFGSATVWTSDNDGAGSGLDADSLDGIGGSEYVRRTTTQTITGIHTYQATQVIQDGNRIDFGTGNDVRFQFGGTNFFTDLYNNAEWSVRRTQAAVLIRLDSDTGHLQIGNGEPAAACRLHIVDEDTLVGGTTGNSEEYRRLQFRGGSGGNDFKVQEWGLRDATGTSWTTLRYHNSIGIDVSFQTPGTNTKVFWERDPNSGFQYWGNAANYVLTVDGTNERVGIGTINPQSLLHIAQGANSTATNLIIENTDTSILNTAELGKIEFTSNDASTNGTGIAASIRVVAENDGSIYGLAFNTQVGATRTERVRIDGSGNVGIGTDDPESLLHVEAADGDIGEIVIKGGNNTVTAVGEINSQLLFASNDGSPAGAEDIGTKITQVTENTAGSRLGIGFHTYSSVDATLAERVRITHDGNMDVDNDVTAANFILSSDKNLKKNIEDLPSDNLINVKWRTFNMNNSTEKRYGVIAQELEKEHPEFVRTNNKGIKSVAYVDLLVAKNAELEERVSKLEQIIHKLSK